MKKSKILILGLGNPLLGDDGAGWAVVFRVHELTSSDQIQIGASAGKGNGLLEQMLEAEWVILALAVSNQTCERPAFRMAPLGRLERSLLVCLGLVEEKDLNVRLAEAKKLGIETPKGIQVMVIEYPQNNQMTDRLSAEMSGLIPSAAVKILELANQAPWEE